MFSGPQSGDDFDPSLVTRSELATSLLNFATNTGLGETQVTSIQALTQAQGNSTIISSLDQRVTSELANKLEAGSLTSYALQTSVTQPRSRPSVGESVSANRPACNEYIAELCKYQPVFEGKPE